MKPLFTVVAAPASDRTLISLDDLREQLQVKATDTANNVWWQKVIARTSRQAERYCNRIFVTQSYVDNFRAQVSGQTGEPLILSQAPVVPTSIIVTIDTVTLAAGTDYGLDQYAGLVYRLTPPMYWTSETSLAVQYTAGFAPIPDDVQQAVLDLCTMDNSGRGRDPMLRASETPGLGRQEYWVGGLPGGALIPQDIAGLLNPYRRGLVA
jgi:hypothetical protein